MTKKEDFIIRDYCKDDYQELMELWESTGVGNAKRGDNPDIIEKTLQQGGKLILLEEIKSKNIIGSSWLTSDCRRIYLHHFAIRKDFQGQKLSKLLLDDSLKFAREQKLQIKLEVHKENVKALKLYTKAGFKYLGDYLVYIIRDIG
jgi:ribosomal protein S18 acetylase RimI-like enzyme